MRIRAALLVFAISFVSLQLWSVPSVAQFVKVERDVAYGVDGASFYVAVGGGEKAEAQKNRVR